MNKILVSAKSKYLPIIFFAIILVAGLLGIAYFTKLSSSDLLSHGAVRVTTASVSTINKPLEIVLPGLVQSRQAIIISAEIPGRISELNAKEGETVKAGQQLVLIDGSGEQIIVEAPSNALENQGSDLQANYDRLLKEYDRYQKLYQVGGIARKQFEDVSARLQAAREAIQSGSYSSANNNQSRPIGSATLTAPISGKVSGLAVAVGKKVQPGHQLMVLDTGGDVRVVVHLAQKDLYLIKAGTAAEITIEGSNEEPLLGQVEAIYPETGADKPTFLTHIRVNNTNSLLKPEMPVGVHLKTEQATPVHAVPRSAVIKEHEGNYLFFISDNKVVKQQITLGTTIDDLIEITSKIPEHAIVITHGMNSLKDGDTLTMP